MHFEVILAQWHFAALISGRSTVRIPLLTVSCEAWLPKINASDHLTVFESLLEIGQTRTRLQEFQKCGGGGGGGLARMRF